MSDNEIARPAEATLQADNAAVIKHMEMYQGIITRMANNSAECKKWCIPLVTVILGLIITEQKYGLVLLSILPIGIFYFLDSYYLMLENSFREGFASSAKKISMGKFTKKDLFLLLPEDEKSQYWQKAFTSKATFLVYSGLLILTAVGFILAVI